MSAWPYHLLLPEALQTWYRACSLVLAVAVPCSWAMGLKGWGTPTVGPVTPWGRETGAGGQTRLRSMEEQRHKPLCFSSLGKRWQCHAPAIPSGLLWFKRSCCSLETALPWRDLGMLSVLQGGPCGALAWIPFAAHRERALWVRDRARVSYFTSTRRKLKCHQAFLSSHHRRVFSSVWVGFSGKKSTVYSCLWF